MDGVGDLHIATPGCSACVVGGSMIECWTEPTSKAPFVGSCPGSSPSRWIDFGQAISAGRAHYCVLDGGAVRCPRAEVALPEPVVGVAVLGDTSCAWTAAGAAYCWGSYIGGTSDVADTTSRAVRKMDLLPPVREILRRTATSGSGCAISLDDELWCWGAVSPPSLVATAVTAASDEVARACWFAHGKVSCDLISGFPHEVLLPPTKQVSLHGRSGCAVLEDGNVICWGDNRKHELGKSAPASGWDWTTPYRIVW